MFRARLQERFDVMAFRSRFASAKPFGFLRGKRSATFTLEQGQTANLDKYLGEKWDLVARDSYLVTSISFLRAKFNPAAMLEKLRCHISLISFSDGDDAGYRARGIAIMQDRHRLVSSRVEVEPLVFTLGSPPLVRSPTVRSPTAAANPPTPSLQQSTSQTPNAQTPRGTPRVPKRSKLGSWSSQKWVCCECDAEYSNDSQDRLFNEPWTTCKPCGRHLHVGCSSPLECCSTCTDDFEEDYPFPA